MNKPKADKADKASIQLVPLEPKYLPECLAIWNEIVLEGLTFPWIESFGTEQLLDVLKPEDTVYCAVDQDDTVLGLFHVHPNGEGRCAHIANCGYMVGSFARHRGVGRLLVQGSLDIAKKLGYRGMQFNAVVSTNTVALKLYLSEGFKIVGTVPNGFLLKTGQYVDMHIMFQEVQKFNS